MGLFDELDKLGWLSEPPPPPPPAEDAADTARETSQVLIVERAGHMFLTNKIEEAAIQQQDLFTTVYGTLLSVGVPNRNSVMWLRSDIDDSYHGLRGCPVNWLHDDSKIVGAITSSEDWPANEVSISARLWNWVMPPDMLDELRQYARSGQAYFSMECIAEYVEVYPIGDLSEPLGVYLYRDFTVGAEGVPKEYLDRSKFVRRLVNPIFMGAAIIVPPAEPGDPNAKLEMVELSEASIAYEIAAWIESRVRAE